MTQAGIGTLTLNNLAGFGGALQVTAGTLFLGGTGPYSVGAITGSGTVETAANLTSDNIIVSALQIDAGATLAIRVMTRPGA